MPVNGIMICINYSQNLTLLPPLMTTVACSGFCLFYLVAFFPNNMLPLEQPDQGHTVHFHDKISLEYIYPLLHRLFLDYDIIFKNF